MKFKDAEAVLDHWWFTKSGCPRHEFGVYLNEDLEKLLKKEGITKSQFHKWLWKKSSHNLIYIDGSC